MGKEFTVSQRKRIVSVAIKASTYDIARTQLSCEGINVSVSGIKKLVRRTKKTRRYENKKRSGRPRKTNSVEDYLLCRLVRKSRQMPFTQLAKELKIRTGTSVSHDTIGRRLKERGYRRRRAIKRPAATPKQKERRLIFSKSNLNRPDIFWHRIKFSDEKIFATSNDSKCILVTRKVGERTHPDCMPGVKRWGVRVHVWAIIGWDGVGPIRRIVGNLTAQKYTDQIIYDIPDICRKQVGRKFVRETFQQDNARPHVANHTLGFLQNAGVKTLEWPANSPDLSPIENCWSYASRIVNALPPARTANELWERVQEAWNSIPRDYIRKLYRSIPNRLRTVIEKGGGYGKY